MVFLGLFFFISIKDIIVAAGDLSGKPFSNTEDLITSSLDFATGKNSDPKAIIFSDYALNAKEKKDEGIDINIPEIDLGDFDIDFDKKISNIFSIGILILF